jgi:hypothetical protein
MHGLCARTTPHAFSNLQYMAFRGPQKAFGRSKKVTGKSPSVHVSEFKVESGSVNIVKQASLGAELFVFLLSTVTQRRQYCRLIVPGCV